MNNAVRTVRRIVATHGQLDAVRYLRGLGLSFQTARQYVREIAANAPWWRCYR